jgi:protein involved in polysaccharide export with SLBB domain
LNRRLFLWAIISISTVSTVRGQVPSTSNILEQLGNQRALQALMSQQTETDAVKAFPMEGAIDVNRYIVGPSDVFNVGLWGGPVANLYSVTVSIEGTMIIPSIGEVRVDQMKLVDVKKEVANFVKRKFPASNVTVTLMRTRSFLVSLRGSIPRSGQYTATPVDRLEKILAK